MGEDGPPSLSGLLGLSPGSIQGIVGAGGKTGVMFHLGAELRAAGHRVVATSTTHMAVGPLPDGFTLILDESPEGRAKGCAQALESGTIPLVLAGQEGNKYLGWPKFILL